MSNLNEFKRRVVTNVENKPFWEAAGQGRLMVGFCNACGENHYYPRSICPICYSTDTELKETSGLGQIYSFSVTRQADPPHIIAYVTLNEGVTMLTNIVDCDAGALRIGQRVGVHCVEAEDGCAIPMFAPL
ncbi:MAG: OB-fold domain-containing protein [Tabrizicola sp.]|nr:OB-fold domain-containing protein [Tabrizicola sp.]